MPGVGRWAAASWSHPSTARLALVMLWMLQLVSIFSLQQVSMMGLAVWLERSRPPRTVSPAYRFGGRAPFAHLPRARPAGLPSHRTQDWCHAGRAHLALLVPCGLGIGCSWSTARRCEFVRNGIMAASGCRWLQVTASGSISVRISISISSCGGVECRHHPTKGQMVRAPRSPPLRRFSAAAAGWAKLSPAAAVAGFKRRARAGKLHL